MKKVLIISSVLIGAIVLLVFFLLLWHGMFTKPVISEKELGPYAFVYDEFKGDYKDTGPIFEKVYNALNKLPVNSTVGIAIYLDDPATVPAAERRSQCGSVFDLNDSIKVIALEPQFKLGNLPRQKYIVVEFPIKSSLSYMLGPSIGYPALTKYATEKNYAFAQPIEIYDMSANVTLYAMPVVAK